MASRQSVIDAYIVFVGVSFIRNENGIHQIELLEFANLCLRMRETLAQIDGTVFDEDVVRTNLLEQFNSEWILQRLIPGGDAIEFLKAFAIMEKDLK